MSCKIRIIMFLRIFILILQLSSFHCEIHQQQEMTTTESPDITKVYPKNVNESTAIQDKRLALDEEAEFCNTFLNETANVSTRVDMTSQAEVSLDFNNLLNQLSQEINNYDDWDDWQNNSTNDRSRHFLYTQSYSDVKFVLGPDDDTQIIYAHKIMLARASPMFEAMFNDSTTGIRTQIIRVKDISTNIFKILLQYVYTGSTFFSTFEEACKMLDIASKLKMPDLAKFCRYHLWMNMYPNNVWEAYQCALAANDTIMTKTALSIIQRKTDEALMDSSFSKIPQSTLVAFLQNDELNVTSELMLFQASLRWAMAEAERRGLPQEAESLRACLNPVLQHIRFLTLTPIEFANLQYTSRILSYSESLAVIFNLNAPGIMPVPKHLSSNKNNRNIGNETQYFEIIENPSFSSNCEGTNLEIITHTNIFDALTTSILKGDSFKVEIIKSILVPRRLNNHCPNVDEEFMVYVFGPENQLLHTEKFKTNCQDINKQDKDFHIVKFNKNVNISDKNAVYKIKIAFYKSGLYPYSLGTGNGEYNSSGWGSTREWKLGASNFVYSIRNFLL